MSCAVRDTLDTTYASPVAFAARSVKKSTRVSGQRRFEHLTA